MATVMVSTSPVTAVFAELVIGLETSFQNLTMFPLLERPKEAEGSKGPSYLLLDEALTRGLTEITEISERGRVPELLVLNRSPQPVLIIDGEELVGAKQNRIVNATILVPANSNLTIPVTCVEAGRWQPLSRTLTAAPRIQYATGRARRMAQVSQSIHLRGSYVSDQNAVWWDIAMKSARLGAHSPTSAMEAIFVRHGPGIEKFVDACRPFDEQVGVLFAIGTTVVGMDLFDRPSTLRRMLPKLVRSVAVDAIDYPGTDLTPLTWLTMRAEADRFLAAVSSAPQREANSVGLGTDVRLTKFGIGGAALVVDEHVVHLSAFGAAALA